MSNADMEPAAGQGGLRAAPDLQEDPHVEALLAAHARRHQVPPGLAGRVYEASVGHLPVQRPRRARIFRLEPVRSASLWGRLALAAAVAMAFGVAVQVLQPKQLLSPHAELALWEYAQTPDLGLATVIDFEHEGFSAMESMLVTRDMTYTDLDRETDDLATQFGM